MAQLLSSLSAAAAANPHAQFPQLLSADEIVDAPALNHLYSRRMAVLGRRQPGVRPCCCAVLAPRGNWVSRPHTGCSCTAWPREWTTRSPSGMNRRVR